MKSSLVLLCLLSASLGCSPSAEVPNVNDIQTTQAAQLETPQGADAAAASQKANADLDANQQKINELNKSLETLSKQFEAKSQMSDAERKQLEAKIAQSKLDIEAEQAKRIELEKMAAAAKAAAEAAPPAFQKSAKLSLVYENDCVDILNNVTDDGVQAKVYPCKAASDSQQFILETVAANSFRLVNVKSTKCLAVENGSTADGARIVQLPCKRNADPAELFNIAAGAPPAAAKYRSSLSQKCLKTGTDGLIFLGNCATVYTMYEQKAPL